MPLVPESVTVAHDGDASAHELKVYASNCRLPGCVVPGKAAFGAEQVLAMPSRKTRTLCTPVVAVKPGPFAGAVASIVLVIEIGPGPVATCTGIDCEPPSHVRLSVKSTFNGQGTPQASVKR